MLVRYPKGLARCSARSSLIDMRRYTKLLAAGASWIAEYGDLDKPASGREGKPIRLITLQYRARNYPLPPTRTTAHPGHARKMAAKLQAMGYEAHFLIEPGGRRPWPARSGDLAARNSTRKGVPTGATRRRFVHRRSLWRSCKGRRGGGGDREGAAGLYHCGGTDYRLQWDLARMGNIVNANGENILITLSTSEPDLRKPPMPERYRR